MAAIVRIDTRSNTAKILLNYLKSLPFVKVEEQADYDPKFVKKILDSDKNDKRTRIKTKSVWDAI
jgi:hypothetical protein